MNIIFRVRLLCLCVMTQASVCIHFATVEFVASNDCYALLFTRLKF